MARKMAKRKTLRNTLISKEKSDTTTTPTKENKSVPAIIPEGKLTKKNIGDFLFKTNPKELRSSIHSVREWSSQMRGTMIQMEQTLDTLTNLIGMYERWQGGGKSKRLPGGGAKVKEKDDGLSFAKMLNTIDFQQIITILNSPLLQALMEFNDSSDDNTAKKDNA